MRSGRFVAVAAAALTAVAAAALTAIAIASAADGEAMVGFPAGSFVMGTSEGPADERPPHTVVLGAFAIDRLPVDNARFAEFLNAVGPLDGSGRRLYDFDDPDARIHRIDGRFRADPGYDDHPVVEASWRGARDYCRWRGKRLPTEAERERAARGATARLYPWGSETPDAARAHFGGRYNDTRPVGSWPAGASPEGVLDLAGNVHEWVSSRYLPYPYRAEDGREDPDHSGERVIRGGAHDTGPETLKGTWRGRGVSRSPAAGHHNFGFRCAR